MNYFSDVTIAMTILSTLVFTLLRKLRSRVRCLLHHLGGRLHQQQLPEEPHVHRQPELPKHLLIVFSHMQIHSFKGSWTQSSKRMAFKSVSSNEQQNLFRRALLTSAWSASTLLMEPSLSRQVSDLLYLHFQYYIVVNIIMQWWNPEISIITSTRQRHQDWK